MKVSRFVNNFNDYQFHIYIWNKKTQKYEELENANDYFSIMIHVNALDIKVDDFTISTDLKIINLFKN